MLKNFISYYRPYKGIFIVDLIVAVAISILGLLYPILTRNILNDFIPNRNLNYIIIFGLSLLGVYILRMLLRYFMQYTGHMIGVKMQADMRSDMFAKLQKLPYTYFDNNETGTILSKMVNDLGEVIEFAHHIPTDLLSSSVLIIGSFIYLCTIDILLSVIIFSCIPLLVFIRKKTSKELDIAFTEARQGVAKVNTSIESSVTGIRVTKAYTNAQQEYKKFQNNNNFLINARKKGYRALARFICASSFVTDLFNVVILIAGGIALYAGRITFGDFSTFVISINLFINPIITLIRLAEQYQNGMTGFRRFLEVLDERQEVDHKEAKAIRNVKGSVEFKAVTFGYEQDKNVLDNISFKIKAGKTLALVGSSGGGKTTLCNLLMRFYEINAGEIMIDGTSIQDITYDSLRKNIGIVQQDVFLFSGTIYDNIQYGRVGATKEEVIVAAKQANIHDFIMTLENEYSTDIGERGIKLSGGQKQRISLARLFLKNPPILILDEATSALDNTTENMIQKELNELCKGKTTIVVAHRLSTVKNADHILVVEKSILEEGSHDYLINKNGIYKSLYDLQFRKAS